MQMPYTIFRINYLYFSVKLALFGDIVSMFSLTHATSETSVIHKVRQGPALSCVRRMR